MLTEPDYRLFEAIDRHGPLPSHYLYEFTKHLRRDLTHLQNRLTEFYNGDAQGAFLTRPPQQFASYQGRYQHVVYDLAPRARQGLAERGTLTSCSRLRTDPFVHRLMTACVGASFELTARALGLRFIALDEILSRPKCGARDSRNPLALPVSGGGQAAIIPDLLFGLEYPGAGFRFFAVEADRHTESIERKNFRQSAFARKVESYAVVLCERSYREWWGLPNLHVLTVTTSAIHAKRLLAHMDLHVDDPWKSYFAVAVEPSYGANWYVPRALLSYLLNQPWRTPQGKKAFSTP